MAGESFVTANGHNLHLYDRTIGGQTVGDEAVQLGEPWLAEYRIMQGVAYTSWATADSHLVQVMAGATLNVWIRRIRLYQHVAATTAALFTLQVVRLTSAGTGGTVNGPAPMDVANDPAAGCTSMTLPTVKGTESTIYDQAEAYAFQTLGASQQPPGFALVADFDYRGPRQKAIRIAAGVANGVALKNRSAIAGATGHVVVDLVEATF